MRAAWFRREDEGKKRTVVITIGHRSGETTGNVMSVEK